MRLAALVLLLVVNFDLYARDFPVPGFDGYQNMIGLLGKPKAIQVTPDGKNYIYSDVVVNISGVDQSTILTISFNAPNVYQKYPGLDVGVSSKQLLSRLSDYYEHRDGDVHFITDYQRSLVFWIKNGRVVKLVQVREGMLKRLR